MLATATTFLPEHLWSDLICAFLFGMLLIALIGFGVKIIDKIWTRLDLEDQVQQGNVAAGIAMGSLVIGLSVSVALVLKSVIG